jgi:ABC transporter substrate binding protein (PQQ-dependent alcohol dehydrogenase system)
MAQGFWLGLALLSVAAAAFGQAPPATSVTIVYLGQQTAGTLPLSYLDRPPLDEGVQGARVGVMDDNTTGQFTNQDFHLDEAVAPDAEGVIATFKARLAAGDRLFVADLPAALLLQAADLPEAREATIIDASSADDALRAQDCRRNLLHALPSRAMLADALMQYLVVKKWMSILLVTGPDTGDRLYADAIRASAHKFRVRVVQEIPWSFDPGARRTDTGHYAIQAEVARITQGVKDYDLLVVADEGDNFGDELAYRTTDPRPIAGTQGLVATAWARPFEQWGATQLQARFLKEAKRWMTSRDYGAWLAARAIGEAATRTASGNPAVIAAYMRGPDFDLAGFKGTKLTFRDWDGQLRQPVLLADDRALVSVSPQPGFLSQSSELDTLGLDRPETKCHPP